MTNADSAVIRLCLDCFYAIMGFSFIPKEALLPFVATLCRFDMTFQSQTFHLQMSSFTGW